jgi:NADH-quinone oxidoreductase subunit J
VAIVAGALLLVQVIAIAGHHWATGAHATRGRLGVPREGNVETLAKSLFTDFVWAFEITAVLLVIAVVGGVALARRSGQRAGGPPPAERADTGQGSGT